MTEKISQFKTRVADLKASARAWTLYAIEVAGDAGAPEAIGPFGASCIPVGVLCNSPAIEIFGAAAAVAAVATKLATNHYGPLLRK
jgi:hypothetical protein